MKYIHVSGVIVEAGNQEGIYKDSPSWMPYVESEVETEFTKIQLEEIAKKQGVNTKDKAIENIVEEIKIKDTKEKRDFSDNLIG